MLSPVLVLVSLLQICAVLGGILDLLKLSTIENNRRIRNTSLETYANQGASLLALLTDGLNSLRNIDESPTQYGQLFPTVNFLNDVPVVPGVMGSVQGAGDCLPRGLPFISSRSPSVVQDLLRNIPGAQDMLKSLLVSTPFEMDARALMGRWHWVTITPSDHSRYCSTSEYGQLVSNEDDASFVIFDSFREGSEHGAPKIGFGYGLKNGRKVDIYMQQDPCPYQVIMIGPNSATSNGQYEYMIMSNWVKYPIIGMVRNLDLYQIVYRTEMEQRLEKRSYKSIWADMLGGSVAFLDWNVCRFNPVTTGNIVGNIINNLLFG